LATEGIYADASASLLLLLVLLGIHFPQSSDWASKECGSFSAQCLRDSKNEMIFGHEFIRTTERQFFFFPFENANPKIFQVRSGFFV
jgi:hypothetical protein